ncbi:reverse transcriptase [Gossypium australe]|uniref:Reverse transcriptase n=1 Tax=Gossypium australe TaxID=47621 RepID=A0A5B6UF33_9ROSI|nr:reverse transcriptase [Gossypium australe]
METKLDKHRMERVRRRCGFLCGIEVEAEGSMGGLCLAWKEDFKVKLRSFSKWHIDVIIKEDDMVGEWRFTGIYGSAYLKEKHTVWNLLRSLAHENSYPWLVEGDFNEILYSFEKSGRTQRDMRRMDAFREALDDYQLMDIGYSGVWFTWERGSLMEKLERLQLCLTEWARAKVKEKEGLKKELTKKLELLLAEEVNDDTMAEIIDTKIHLNLKIDKYEMYWEQRARANWLMLGDKNSAYFHNWAVARRRANTISKLETEEGRALEEGAEIMTTATDFFKDLFTSRGLANASRVLDGIESKISFEDNEFLVSPFTTEDIQGALKEMGPTKAPGADGFPALFFQRCCAHSKIPRPTKMINFRPISLCSVVYKIIAKAIVHRLQSVIDRCIDKVQSAFVPGRLISDNVLLAYEILHTLRQKRTGKKGIMAVKLDMSKAYDRVEWGFIQEVMTKMGFARKWVELIGRCVSSVSYAIIINGRRGNLFFPTRGLRQGDPLSPFLFLICSEGLSSLMRIARRDGLLRGQCVNFAKSTVFYSPNTTEVDRDAMLKLLRVKTATNPEKYLGLPNMVGRRKNESFQSLVDRALMRIDGWSNKFLSQGGKEIFIKAVLQAIPTYAMSCFLLPNSLCRKMESIFAKFWWQKGKGRKGIHWCQWNQLCRPKNEGGLGFRDLAQFNIALLAKQGWRFLTNPDSLVAQVFKAKYFLGVDFINSQLGNKHSFVWRSIWAAKGVLEKGIIWKVGTGINISIYRDVWVSSYGNSRLLSAGANLSLSTVAELIDNQSREWNREVIRHTFAADEADRILRIPLARIPHEDFRAWSGEQSGEFSKASWNYLPTRANLFHKKLLADASCPRCGLATETIDHLFRECPLSVEVWTHIKYVNHSQFSSLDFIQWLTKTMDILLPDLCRIFCGTLWAIWGDRNARIHERTNRTGQEVVNFVLNYIHEIDGVKNRIPKVIKNEKRWRNPPQQVVKINFDGAFDKDGHQSASGVVARNSEGKVLVSGTSLHEMVDSAFAAEAIACREAVQMGINMQKEEIWVEGDSLTVIKKCKNPGADRSQIGAYIKDIHQMQAVFKSIRFYFIPRTANNLAHTLATEALKRKEECYLIGGVPYFAESHMRDRSLREPD